MKKNRKVKEKNTSRDALIDYIQANDEFYRFVNFSGHALEQIKKIKEKIESGKTK
jgi:hypothetical protein